MKHVMFSRGKGEAECRCRAQATPRRYAAATAASPSTTTGLKLQECSTLWDQPTGSCGVGATTARLLVDRRSVKVPVGANGNRRMNELPCPGAERTSTEPP